MAKTITEVIKMDWFTVIKAPPPITYKGDTWKHFAPDDIPCLEEHLNKTTVPWESIWPTASRKMFLRKDNSFTPRINAAKGAAGFWAVINVETCALVDDGWEEMYTREYLQSGNEQSETAVQFGMGKHTITLTKNQIGVEVKLYGRTPVVEVTIPVESSVLNKLGQKRTEKVLQGKYELNNGEAAALAILGIFAEQRKPRLRQERIRLFDEFGIGPLEKESPSKYLRSLDSKGLVEYGSDRDDISRSNRGYPTITMEGYREATMQVDMPRAIFFSEEMEEGPDGKMIPFGFKAKVKKQPDERYTGYEGGASKDLA